MANEATVSGYLQHKLLRHIGIPGGRIHNELIVTSPDKWKNPAIKAGNSIDVPKRKDLYVKRYLQQIAFISGIDYELQQRVYRKKWETLKAVSKAEERPFWLATHTYREQGLP
ncbi:MAG: hypothetical protein Q9191_003038 [Dirinaria sp. TL-2023a]